MQSPPATAAAESGTDASSPKPGSRWMKAVTWSACCALSVYALLLFLRARSRQHIVPVGSEVTLTDLLAIRDLVYASVLSSIQMGACLLLFGFLAGVALGPPRPSRGVLLRIGRWIAIVLLGTGVFGFLYLVETGRIPGFLSSALPMCSYLIGLWIGRTTVRGPRALAWLVPKLLGLCVIAVAAVAGFGYLAVSGEPLSIQPPKITSAEKRRLFEIVKTPRTLDNGFRQLSLTGRDLNLILAMGLRQVLPRSNGRISLEEGTVFADLTIPLDDRDDSPRYANIQSAWEIAIIDGEFHVDLVRCRIGRLPVPGFIRHAAVHQAMALVVNDRDLNNLLTAVGSFQVSDERVEAVLVSRGLLDEVFPSLMSRLGQDPNVVSKTRLYYEHLSAPIEAIPAEDRFAAIVQSAFALARTRSKTEDPVLENRAAILAMAVMLGHWRLEHLIGAVTDEPLRRQARSNVGYVRLRGRTDWSRHFLVSAALALLGNESLSDEAGLSKEEIDAGEGGSGFSFTDLLADRAGTSFALAATRDEQAARRMQSLLADGFEIDVIFPQAADLPEGIPDAQFEAEYGGVGGEKYKAMIAEIERRLGECEGLR